MDEMEIASPKRSINKDGDKSECEEEKPPIITTTKNALITTQVGPCEAYPHRVKVSIVGAGKTGMSCAIAILMRKMASEVCLIDKDGDKASAEAEDIQHAGIFLGSPLVTGSSGYYGIREESLPGPSCRPSCHLFGLTLFQSECFMWKHSDISMVKDSAVVIISKETDDPDGLPNVKHNLETFKKLIPSIAKFACKAVLLVATQPIDIMSYITWKLSRFPSNRVLGTGTLVDCAKFQDLLSQRLGLARSSISCMTLGAQGDNSVPIWSSVQVAGMNLRDINPRIGEKGDPEKWYEITETKPTSNEDVILLGPGRKSKHWLLGICTAEIVDAILRNTKVVLPASTYIHSCSHGTDKDVYMSVPCVLGREGVYRTVRQKLTEQEKTAVQTCADSIRGVLRECGILREAKEDTEE